MLKYCFYPLHKFHFFFIQKFDNENSKTNDDIRQN